MYIPYRQCMHEVFHSFPPTSPSRVTTWWEATSCSEWWKWLSHDSTSVYLLEWNFKEEQPHTYTVHECWWYIRSIVMYVAHWHIRTCSMLTPSYIAGIFHRTLCIIWTTQLYMYIRANVCIIASTSIGWSVCGYYEGWTWWLFQFMKELFQSEMHQIECFLKY